MTFSLNIEEILAVLPQRYPFLFLDKITALNINHSITAVKNVSMNEHFFQGHFPTLPIMPGVLLIEAMAQAMSVLGYYSQKKTTKNSGYYVLAAVNNAKFKRPVVPGDQLIIQVTIERIGKEVLKCYACITVKRQMVCETIITGVWKACKIAFDK